MLTTSTDSPGFAVPAHDEHARDGSTLPALIATISLMLSIAVVLTAVTMNAARARAIGDQRAAIAYSTVSSECSE